MPMTTTAPTLSPMQNVKQIQPQIWESESDGKQVYDNVVKNEGEIEAQNQNALNYGLSAIKGGINMITSFKKLKNSEYTDKYKHALMNCQSSQYGEGGSDIAKFASDIKEWADIKSAGNTLDSSNGDQYANKIGRILGNKYPNGDCDALVQKYIKKIR